ncbi:MAG: cellulase family glycosylhydrolase [Candidatus Omnitrophica bacterium]|nr:cellulase family glycosylhydrolase [Candidatus Omnitrophota bacterium]
MNSKTIIILSLAVVLTAGRCWALPAADFKLYDEGAEPIIDYNKYGEFKDIGKESYKYVIKDREGLSSAAGEGIFPNTKSIDKDPGYQKCKKEKRLLGSHWLFINNPDSQANFYRWATAAEEPGVKLFYTAFALEHAGQIKHAIKAYYALVINFPRSVGYTYWDTPWYVGPASLDRILYLTQKYPELGIKCVDAKFHIKRRYDNDRRNDVFVVDPGRLVKVSPDKVGETPVNLKQMPAAQKKKYGSIEFIRYENGHWQMLVESKPYMIKAVAYQPSKIGQSPDIGTLKDWSFSDENNNGKSDSPYDAWLDKNRNNVRDKDERAVGDFQLMKDLGVNTVRVYHHTGANNKEIFKDLYKSYGIRIMLGDFLGMYAVGSKAPWEPGTNYSDSQQQRNMLDSVMQMVNEYKDEPCLLMWVLGNENNYGTANNADEDPKAYYHFVNEVAKKIKEVDPNHPVMICNGDIQFLDVFAEECPDVDVFGVNAYRGNIGFGRHNFWMPIKELADKPAFITEYGCPAYGRGFNREQAEEFQAEYLGNNWKDIEDNSAGKGAGIAIGGSLFEFVDEWWKTGAPPGYPDIIQDVVPNCGGPFLDGWYYEEWFGLTSQGDGTDSPYLRKLRKSYFKLQELWKEKE